jgi:hypothetical protein
MGSRKILYAAIGAGELALDTARKARESLRPAEVRQELTRFRADLPKRLEKTQRGVTEAGNEAIGRGLEIYEDLVKRGKNRVLGIRNSAPTKRAAAQTKTARRQAKAAVTSVRKAATETVEAATKAATGL